MMKHDDAALLLTDFLQGRLGDEARDEMARHVAACEECSALAETFRTLRAAGPRRADEPAGGHPATEEVVLYAAMPSRMEMPDLARIGAHVQECPSCAEEVAITRRAQASVGARHLRRSRGFLHGLLGGQRWPMLSAAAVTFLVLAYPAYLGLVHLPRLAADVESLRSEKGRLAHQSEETRASLEKSREALAQAEERLGAWLGPVSLTVLNTPLRGEGPTTVVRIAEGQPYAPLALLPSIPEDAAPGDRFIFEIRREDGEIVWSLEMTAARIREDLRITRVVTFLVPTSKISPGTYRFVVRSATREQEPILDTGFEVVVAP